MKKNIIKKLCLLLVVAIFLEGVFDVQVQAAISEEVRYTVTFDTRGGSEIDPVTVASGYTIRTPSVTFQ